MNKEFLSFNESLFIYSIPIGQVDTALPKYLLKTIQLFISSSNFLSAALFVLPLYKEIFFCFEADKKVVWFFIYLLIDLLVTPSF